MTAADCRGILVVDDDEAIRMAVGQALREAGYQVATANNGSQALSWLRSHEERPCVILLDLMMPVMDGRAFREAQLQDPALAEVPVVVLTAAGHKSAIRGAQTCLAKPIRLDALLNAVAGYC